MTERLVVFDFRKGQGPPLLLLLSRCSVSFQHHGQIFLKMEKTNSEGSQKRFTFKVQKVLSNYSEQKMGLSTKGYARELN